MAKMYAWSTIRTKVNDWGQAIESVKPGDVVTKEKLSVSDADWDAMIASGAIREEEYPDIPDHISPAEHYAAQDAALSRGELSDEEAKEVRKRQARQAGLVEVPAPVEEAKPADKQAK